MIIIRYVWNFRKRVILHTAGAAASNRGERTGGDSTRRKKSVPCWEEILCYRGSFVNRKSYFRRRRHGSLARIWCDGGATSVGHSSPTPFLPLPHYGRTARRTTLRPVFTFHRRDIHTNIYIYIYPYGLHDTTVQTIPFSGAAFR